MQWYSTKKFRPAQIGDQIIFLLKTGDIHAGIFDRHKELGFFFQIDEGASIPMHETTHFCIPDPIEIEE